MSLTDAKQRLAAALSRSYRLERELGQGGMATVYLAHDLKHDRQVAIKILRPELAAVIGAERFLSEIKTTANLQHPHILALFDSGTADSYLFYVMPFVEGESLRDRLMREKQLPIADAIRIATEVASALDYAHRHGVIHRDIKPENILLHDGRALVADFGIALAASKAGGNRMTETGMSLGTPTYMSPEQAMGEREITARSDVYALGAMTYEMLVGEPPFTGPTAQAIIAKIVTADPVALTTQRKTIPAHVEAAVLTALQKLPADRFESAAAFADTLQRGRLDSVGAVARPAARGARSRVRQAAAVVSWIALGALLSAVALWRTGAPGAAGSALRQQATYSGRATGPAISPDGRFLAYRETRCPEPPNRGGCQHLQVLEVGGTRPVEVITGAERLAKPRWTRDGLSIIIGGHLAEGRRGLFLVPRLGGIPRSVGDEPLAYDTHPSADSAAMVVARDSGAMLEVVDLASGRRVGESVPFPVKPIELAWSPDGRRFAASTYDVIYLVRRGGSLLFANQQHSIRSSPRWSIDGRRILVFRWTAGQNDDLTAFPVDNDGRLGAPQLLVSQVPTLLSGDFDVARTTGRIVVGSGAEFSDIWSFDLSASAVRARRLTQGTSWHGPPTLTADGRALYYLRADPLGNGLYSIVDGRETALSAEPQIVNHSLRLARDERVIVFESSVNDATVLMVYDIAAGSVRQVPRGGADLGWPLPDGKRIVWMHGADRQAENAALWLTDSAGGNRRELADAKAGATKMSGAYWALAPDGGSIALLAPSPEAWVISLVPLDGGTRTTLARFPLDEGDLGLVGWSRDGAISVARRLMASPGTTSVIGIDATTGTVRPLFVLPIACDPTAVSYAPLGRRAACQVLESRADLMLIDGLRQ